MTKDAFEKGDFSEVEAMIEADVAEGQAWFEAELAKDPLPADAEVDALFKASIKTPADQEAFERYQATRRENERALARINGQKK